MRERLVDIGCAQPGAAGEHDRAVEHVPQLAHVAGPLVAAQAIERAGVERGPVACEQVAGELFDALGPLA